MGRSAVELASFVVTFLYLAWLALHLMRGDSGKMKTGGTVLLAVLLVQVGLGISNVVFSLPLFIAVAHNAVAACLLLVMVWVTYSLYRPQGATYG